MVDNGSDVIASTASAHKARLEEAMEISMRSEISKEYLHLRREIVNDGLLERQYTYYAVNIALALGLLSASIAIVIVFDQLWVQLLNAVFMAMVFGLFNFIGHDAGHRQIFRSARNNDAVFLLAASVTGITPSWWQDKHNAHHRNPNHVVLDSDINIPVYAFTEERALQTRGFVRFIVKRQAFFLYPFHCLTSLVLLGQGIAYLVRRQRLRYPIAEMTAVIAGVGLYLAILWHFLPAWHAVLFILVHRALAGLYMGLVFAPNHKGMPVLDSDMTLDYMLRQILTSRNVRTNPVADFAFGGLNYQIEHHLFPNMPRNRLKDARPVVKAFCRGRGISYHETGFRQSQREILGYLHEIGAPLRRKGSSGQLLESGCPAPAAK